MKPTQEEIEAATTRWLNGFFSWEDEVDEGEVDCAREGFYSGTNWALQRTLDQIKDLRSAAASGNAWREEAERLRKALDERARIDQKLDRLNRSDAHK